MDGWMLIPTKKTFIWCCIEEAERITKLKDFYGRHEDEFQWCGYEWKTLYV